MENDENEILAKNNTNSSSSNNTSSSTKARPEMNSGSTQSDGTTNDGGMQGGPMSSDGAQGGPMTMDGEMPEMCDPESETECEMPEMPQDMMNGGFAGRGEMREMMMADSNVSSGTLHPGAYISMGGGAVIVGILISYVIISAGFTKKPGEAFRSLKRFLVFVGVSIVIAVLIGVLCYFVPVWVG